MNLRRRILGGLTAVGSGLAGLIHFGLLNVDQFYSILLPLTYRIAPEVGWLNQSSLEQAVVLLSVVIVSMGVARIGRKLYDRIQS